jgi:hypothetical protein
VGAAGRRPDDAVVVAALPHQPGEPAPADEGSPEPRHPDAPARLVGRKDPPRHEVHAYDPESNSVDTVFSVQEFIDAPREPVLLLNIAMHEETVTVARQGGPSDRRTDDLTVTRQQQVQRMLSAAVALYRDIVNMHN